MYTLHNCFRCDSGDACAGSGWTRRPGQCWPCRARVCACGQPKGSRRAQCAACDIAHPRHKKPRGAPIATRTRAPFHGYQIHDTPLGAFLWRYGLGPRGMREPVDYKEEQAWAHHGGWRISDRFRVATDGRAHR